MRALLREARIVPIIVGNIKRSKFLRRLLPLSTGGTDNARYCYSVWMRHLSYYALYSDNTLPRVVAELGPGDTLGIGLTALLSGVETYFALDVLKFWDNEKNIKVFDEILSLLMDKVAIPGDIEFPNVAPRLHDYTFPKYLLSDDHLKKSLHEDRVAKIRKELMEPDNPCNTIINFQIPWYDAKVIQKGTVDLVFSQAVLEHVDDLKNAYKAMALWLAEKGKMSHTIDFKSHGMTKSWNGHWCLSDFEWKIIRADVFMLSIEYQNPFI